MQQCGTCHKPLKPDEDIFGDCESCLYMYLERAVWPEVRTLLRQFTPTDADLERILTARATLYDKTLPEMANAAQEANTEIVHTISLASHVKRQVGTWRIFEQGCRQYETDANHAHPAVELAAHLAEAIRGRRVFRRYLRRRFGIQALRGFDSRLTSKRLGPAEIDEATVPTMAYLFYEAKFHACLLSAFIAQECGEAAEGIVTAAVEGARHVQKEVFPELVCQAIASPLPWQTEEAVLNIAGVLRLHLRMYPSVRRALGEAGEPRTVLLERLPEYVWKAYREGAREIHALLESVRRLLNQLRRRQPKKSLHHAPEPVLEGLEGHRQRQQNAPSALEEWYAKQETLQRLDALIPRAGLSPREAEFLSLSLSGLSYSAIASQEGVKVGTVKTTMSRTIKKLRKAARS